MFPLSRQKFSNLYEAKRALALFLLSSLIAQLLANFGQHDVGYAGVATGRGGFNLPFKASYDKSTSTLFAVQFQGLDARGHKSKQLVIKSITTLL